MIRNYVLLTLALLVFASAANAQKLTGVWSLNEVKTSGTGAETRKMTQPSMYLFTKRHYSIIFVNGDKARSSDPASKMTAEQLYNTYVDGFIANAGTYDVKSGTLTMHVMVAKSPSFMAGGNWVSYKVSIKGNTMTLVDLADNTGPDKEPSTYTLTRVE
ncbi:MAG: hypothetical protein JO053_08735 [Acidobacteria bacterium]|nr:hypothetical protein [Acidobacteriota bacterium]